MTDQVTETISNEARIPLENLGTLEDKIAKLNRKAEKHGLAPLVLITGEIETERRVRPDYNSPLPPVSEEDFIDYDFINITLEGEVPAIGGYTFAGVVDKTDGITLLAGDIPSEYRYNTDTKWCDHCQTKRNRNKLLVIKEVESGEFMRVGTSCVKDFLPSKSAQDLVWSATWIRSILSELEEAREEGYGGGAVYTNLSRFLAYVHKNIEADGWFISGGYASENECQSTSSKAWYDMNPTPKEREHVIKPVDSDFEAAEKVIDFFRGLDEADHVGNDYLLNVKNIMGLDYISPKHTGYVASSFSAMDRLINGERKKKEAKEQAKKSEYVGEIKKRENFTLTLKKHLSFPNHAHYYAEDIQMYIFEDQDGNAVTWKGTVRMDVNEGDTIILKATVKEHSVYEAKNGFKTKTTYITRGALVEVLETAAA